MDANEQGDGLIFFARQARNQSQKLLPKMKITTKAKFINVKLELLLILNSSRSLFRLPAYCQTYCWLSGLLIPNCPNIKSKPFPSGIIITFKSFDGLIVSAVTNKGKVVLGLLT